MSAPATFITDPMGTGLNRTPVADQPRPTTLVPNGNKTDGQLGTCSNAASVATQPRLVTYIPPMTDCGLGTSIPSGTAPRATHAQATSWAARVITNGGAAVSNATLTAISDMFYNFDAAGFTYTGGAPGFIFYNCFVPDNLIAALTPQIDATGVAWTNFNFVLSDLTTAGLKGNGTNKSIGTGIIPGNWWGNNSAGLSCMVSANAINANKFNIGAGGNNLNSQFAIMPNWSDGHTYFEAWRFDGADVVTATPASSPTVGFFSGNRTGASQADVYFAKTGTALANIGTQTGARVGTASLGGVFTVSIFAVNGAGTLSNWSSERMSMVSGHVGLTSGQSNTLFTISQTVRAALGGGTV